MRLPTRDSIDGLRPISRSLSLDLIAAIGYGATGAVVATLLPTIARRGGLEPLGLALLSAAPFVTNLLSVFAGQFGPRSARQFALLRGIGAGALVALLFVPGVAAIVVVAFVFWVSVSFGAPFQLRLWGATYPGPHPRAGRRACSVPAVRPPPPSPRSPAACSPTGSAGRQRSGWPGSSA